MWDASKLALRRLGGQPLAEQISRQIAAAIAEGALRPGARLPSLRDLAVQLGVARGTVRVAYERLIDLELIVSAGANGTHVADRPGAARPSPTPIVDDLPPEFHHRTGRPEIFQLGVPAQDAFPSTVWARLHRRAAHSASLTTSYEDPRGTAHLRTALAAHLAISRGLACSPEQIIVTSGFRDGLGLVLHALGAAGRPAWIEDPGYPIVRHGLRLAGLRTVALPVDAEGLDVERGIALAPDAVLAVVSPGQQAPTGVALSAGRRDQLLAWADGTGGWIVEDDYLSELQLTGRSGRALAGADPGGRVIHLGTFSKTISPALGLGFIVAPPGLSRRLIEVAAWLSAPPSPATQNALAAFIDEGHYLRHLRRMKKLYGARRAAIVQRLGELGLEDRTPAGLSVLLRLPAGVDDIALARAARAQGMAPSPLSPWFARDEARVGGLLLGVTNVPETRARACCDKLAGLVEAALRGPAGSTTAV